MARDETAELPVDVATMRQTVNVLLDPDAAPDVFPPSGAELETLTATIRGHIEILAPEVEAAARELKPNSIRRHGILSCVWEANSRLEAEPSKRYGGPVGNARRLARSLNALLDHYEALGSEVR